MVTTDMVCTRKGNHVYKLKMISQVVGNTDVLLDDKLLQ